MFGDDDIKLGNEWYFDFYVDSANIYFRFDIELDKFEVDVLVLKDQVVLREFVGWSEDWEKELKKKDCPVVELHFVTKYKNLLFFFEENNRVYTIFKGICSFTVGRLGVGW